MKKVVLLTLVFVLLPTGLALSVVGLLGSQIAHASSCTNNFRADFSSSAANLSLPFHYQSNIYYCGPAALEMVFDYYGEDIPQAEIADVARTHPNVTYLDEMRRATHFSNLSNSLGDEMPGNVTGYSARKIGYAAFEQGGLTLDDLKTLISKGQPLIVLMWWTPSKVYGHYRVIIGYNETHIITHDPWNKDAWGGTYGGANTSMTYSMFLDLWQYSGNWGLLVHPWDIELKMPGIVGRKDIFEVIVNITYSCSTPFNKADYPASSCKATIKLPEGLELGLGETTQHSLGHITAGNSVQTSWSINASEVGFHDISVTVTGVVEGSVWAHETYPPYNYMDEIGGSRINSLSVINEVSRVHNIDTHKNYTTIQAAIDDPDTLDGHTIFVESGAYHEHVIVNKSVSLIGEMRETTIIDGGGYGTVVRIWADGVKISNFTVRNVGTPSPELPPPMDGISAHFSNGEISNNIVEHNGDGIALVFSTNNKITGNRVSENEYGLCLDDSSNNTIGNNDVSSNKKHGIYLWWDSNNNTLTDNKVSENEYGIYFDHSSNNALTNNEVSNNDYGIHLHNSPENILIGNEVFNNEYGIYLNSSRINSIHHNSFFNNTFQAYAFDSYNGWDDSYPSGGNYWSDYEERYPNATEIDGSGIWDTPYVVDESNQDNYPLIPEFPTRTSMLLLLTVPTVSIAICKRRLLKTPIH